MTSTRAFPPHGSLPFLPNHAYALRHAHLPSENVCTENLTPFLNLLPCLARADIATPLNAHKLFDADWHELGTNVVREEGGIVELKMTVQAVFDPVRTSSDGKRDWSLRSIFGRTIERACPIASLSDVELITDRADGYMLEPNRPGVERGLYDLKSVSPPDALSDLNLSMGWTGENKFAYPLDLTATTLSAYSVDRSTKGLSQTTGELALSVRNNLQVQQRVL